MLSASLIKTKCLNQTKNILFGNSFKHIIKMDRQIYLKYSSSSSTSSKNEIVIPNRIKRSPTSILEALSSTVGNDPTAAHYKYHDDPYLIPTSNISKRTYAMALESGRKAAKWIKEEHRELFQHNIAQPPIKAFSPKVLYTEESEVDNDSLRTLIFNSEIKDAIFVYNLMKQKNIEISNADKQSLLELICYYNNEEPLSYDLTEERWFHQGVTGKERNRKTWKDGELAEKIYNEIEPKTAASYSAIIRGMCKYFQVERGWALLQEAIEKEIKLDTKTFNSVIAVGSFLKESGDMRWNLCLELLQQMKQRQLKPDIGTLNACLLTISTIGNNRLARNSALRILSEFKNMGIEQSLATWYYVLIIFCKERGPVSHVLADILSELEGKEFEIHDPKDTFFFVTAMDVCRYHLHDKNLAKKVHNLLLTGNNYNLIGDSYKESIYYRHYFALLCQTEPLEVFMETYELLVPNVYIPEPGIMEEVLKAIDTNGALDLIPKIWSDMIIFDHIGRESLLHRILKIMVQNKPSLEIESQKELTEKFASISFDIYQKINEQNENLTQKLRFTGQMLGDMLIVISRAAAEITGDVKSEWFEKLSQVFTKLDKNQHKISGAPSFLSMESYIEACIVAKRPSEAIKCLEYCVENDFDSIKLASKIKKGFTLDEIHTDKIKILVGGT